VNAYCAVRYAAHPERQHAASNAWRATHQDQIKAANASYSASHREEIAAKGAEWRTANPERQRARTSAWRSENRERHDALIAAWGAENPGRRCAQRVKRTQHIDIPGPHFTGQEWEALKARYDYRCLMCTRQEPKIKLEADHVIPIARGGTNDIGNIQPLCKSCNSSKNDQIRDYRR
jgi:5-methylcytosine-specific restriction endonuclease McrA